METTSGYVEPIKICPNCGSSNTHAEWVDIGFGPYSQQAGPYVCFMCSWVEQGCPAEKCIEDKCISYDLCKGNSLGKEGITSLVFSLLHLLNKEEVSGEGREFHPNVIRSCRVLDTEALNTVMCNLEKISGFKK